MSSSMDETLAVSPAPRPRRTDGLRAGSTTLSSKERTEVRATLSNSGESRAIDLRPSVDAMRCGKWIRKAMQERTAAPRSRSWIARPQKHIPNVQGAEGFALPAVRDEGVLGVVLNAF